MINDIHAPFTITLRLPGQTKPQTILINHLSETFDFQFNGQQVSIINNGDNSWSEVGNALDQETVNLIGEKIEVHFTGLKSDPLKNKHRQIGHTEMRADDIDIVAGARQTGQLEMLQQNARSSGMKKHGSNYKKLGFMMLLSFCIMYGVMFLNVDDSSHIMLSLTRLYMSLLMVSPMAILMILMMPMMYKDKKVNNAFIAAGSIVFLLSLLMLRTQFPIDDRQYMKAMIPHHSSAIMTSKHAGIKDPRVRKLADSIIRSQQREIAEMKALLKSLNE